MKNIILLIGTVFLISASQAKEYSIIQERQSNEHSEVPSYISFSPNNAPSLSDLSSILERYIKSPDRLNLKLIREEKDQLGYVHQVYQQQFEGTPIAFSELRVHLKNGRIYALNGSLVNDAPAYREKSLTEQSALQAALDFIGAAEYKWEIAAEERHLQSLDGALTTYYPKGKLTYVAPHAAINHKKLRLAYVFNVYAHKPMSRTEIYVDASNGNIIFTNDLIHTGNSKGNATTAYSGKKTITTDSVNTTQFRLRQTASGGGVNTYDMNNGNTHGNAVDFTDSDNVWNNVNSNLDQYATDAHWGAEQTYEYYFSEHGRNSIDNNGFALNSYVHYSPNSAPYANAFWDGQRMTYGDGNFSITPLTALDIAGHEITHGLTTFSANLVYASESGALNESFSDIFGSAIEFYSKGSNANWTIGEDIGATLRNMSNPKQYGDPDTRRGTYWKQVIGCRPSQQNDRCGVHSNSGVQNYWFYLLTEGGNGTNDLNQSYSVSGLGIDTAAAIAFRNLTVYLGRTSDYDDARFYSIKSAIDLYGACSRQVKAVTNAWHAVGVGKKYVNAVLADFTSADTINCQTPHEVYFDASNSTNVINFTWDFGDGQSSTLRSPAHTYTSLGDFDVQLIVDGGSCGSDTLNKKNFVSIDTSNSCIIKLQNGLNNTQTTCKGTVVDDGGKSATYTANQNSILTIRPTNAASVTLNFGSFDVEKGTSSSVCDYDYLEVFDGASTNAPSLGKFCNLKTPPSSITSTRGAITIQFVTDPGLQKNGFEINWQCNYPTMKPQVDFMADKDSTCTGLINFRDLTSEGPSNWLWDFGDGNSSTAQDPSHYYTSNGTYNVSLKASNSFGSDSIIKNQLINVNRPTKAMVTNDTACINGNAKLQASGAGDLDWYTDEFGGTSFHTDSVLNVSGLQRDTSFWVENYFEAPTKKLGPANNNIGNGGYYSGDQYLIFDVFKKINLTSVFVYGGSSGNRTIELRDQNGKVLQTKFVYIPNTYYNVSLDFIIEPGFNYQLGVANGSSSAGVPDLYRNNSGLQYPYTTQGLISINNSSAGRSYYYFFYDWSVKEFDCYSAREKVTAVVDSNCTVTSLAEVEQKNSLNLYPNPANNSFYLSFDRPQKVEAYTIYNAQGAIVKQLQFSNQLNVEDRYQINTSSLSEGVYFVNLQLKNRAIRKRLIIIH